MATLQSGSPNGKRRSRVGDFLAVLLLLAILAGIGWLWSRHPQSPKATRRLDEKPPVHQVVPSLVVVERTPEAVTAPPEDENTGTVATVVPVAPPAEPAKTVEPAPAPPVSNAPPTMVSPAPPTPVPTAPPTLEFPRPVKNLLEAQIALARHTISPGSIDGAVGSQTRAALATFQAVAKLACTRTLDTNTQLRLILEQPALTDYQVTGNDLARLQPLGKTWLAKSQQSALEYETILELVAEKAHANPALIQKLNPGIDWANVSAGAILKIPDVIYPEPASKAAFVTIHLSSRCLEAFDTASNLLAHFPCSIAAKVEKRPVGELHVAVLAPHPNYTFNPETFPESPEAQAIGHKLILPPGPNNPVGVAWIGLDKPGYGMHGTPSPEQIGRTESHGCFRLANWDAEYLLKIVYVGLPVIVEP